MQSTRSTFPVPSCMQRVPTACPVSHTYATSVHQLRLAPGWTDVPEHGWWRGACWGPIWVSSPGNPWAARLYAAGLQAVAVSRPCQPSGPCWDWWCSSLTLFPINTNQPALRSTCVSFLQLRCSPFIHLFINFIAFRALTLLVGQEGHLACKKLEWWGAGVVICLERDADLHMAQLMPLPLTVSCFSKIQIVLSLSGTGPPG